MKKGTAGEWFQDDYIGGYFDQNGDLVVCEEYGLTDADTDKYAVELQNGDGYYSEYGKYVSYGKEQKGGVTMAKVETSRMVMNIPTELLTQLDEYASKMNINRTSAVCVLLSQALDSQKAMNDLGELVKLYQSEQNKKTIANQEKLRAVERSTAGRWWLQMGESGGPHCTATTASLGSALLT